MATAKQDTEDTAAELGKEIRGLREDLAALVGTVSDFIGKAGDRTPARRQRKA